MNIFYCNFNIKKILLYNNTPRVVIFLRKFKSLLNRKT